MGDSSKSLAIWLCERRFAREENFYSIILKTAVDPPNQPEPTEQPPIICGTWQTDNINLLSLLRGCDHSECTGAFLTWVLPRYLPQWSWIFLVKDEEHPDGDPICIEDEVLVQSWLLSPHQLGWPMHRPRLYTVGILKEKWTVDSSGLQKIAALFRKPGLNCSCFYCAPSEF